MTLHNRVCLFHIACCITLPNQTVSDNGQVVIRDVRMSKAQSEETLDGIVHDESAVPMTADLVCEDNQFQMEEVSERRRCRRLNMQKASAQLAIRMCHSRG